MYMYIQTKEIKPENFAVSEIHHQIYFNKDVWFYLITLKLYIQFSVHHSFEGS